MKQRVIEAFALDIQRLRDAALELQVDLEMCRYDHETWTWLPRWPIWRVFIPRRFVLFRRWGAGRLQWPSRIDAFSGLSSVRLELPGHCGGLGRSTKQFHAVEGRPYSRAEIFSGGPQIDRGCINPPVTLLSVRQPFHSLAALEAVGRKRLLPL